MSEENPNENPQPENAENENPPQENPAGDDDLENVEVTDIGINTDELPPEELQKLVENNRELLEENDISNIGNEAKDSNNISSNNQITATKKELIDELNEKDKIFELLVKSNSELKQKIEMSNLKYKEILDKIEEKKNEDSERKLTLQIKEMEKEINANNNETERYKKMIDQLKNKIEFKTNLERAFSLQSILKQETKKNNELKNQLNVLMRVNGVQMKYINNYDKENQISEKIDILKSEIKQTKDSINYYQDKYRKQDRFIRLIHEKILSLEMMIKKMKEPKIEKTKLFTKEELKDALEIISKLKNQIKDNRNQLNNITKQNDDKMHQLLAQNKQIELDYKENEKLNRMLVFKKNELKRAIKNSNMGIKNKNYNYLKKNNNKREEINAINNYNNDNDNNNIEIVDNPNNNNMDNYNDNNNYDDNEQQKLFMKNPNKIDDDNNNMDNFEGQNPNPNENEDDNLNDMNDSNAPENMNNNNNNGEEMPPPQEPPQENGEEMPPQEPPQDDNNNNDNNNNENGEEQPPQEQPPQENNDNENQAQDQQQDAALLDDNNNEQPPQQNEENNGEENAEAPAA